MLQLEQNQVTNGLGAGAPAYGGSDSSNGPQPISGKSLLQQFIDQFKNNPEELMMMLLYVYLPAKAAGLENYVAGIGDKLNDIAKLMSDWNNIKGILNEIGKYAQEYRDGNHSGDLALKVYQAVQKLKAALEDFKKTFNEKIPANDNTDSFVKTINQAIDNLSNMPTGEVYNGDFHLNGQVGGVFKMFIDGNQITLKNYMNNFTTGDTAFTSISNYTQEEMQLYGKQYDSAESLIKNGLKTMITQEQTMVNNQRVG